MFGDMLVNGAEVSLEDSNGNKVKTIIAFLDREGYGAGRIAVEKNGKIIPKAKYETEPIDDSDRLEIVTFVGGG
ncbi:MAG: sulfur carrier protein ThiS [Oscillospiraceae bacterium]|nr:sulfur carrier protein ThiS [Oscillospiraceae bacterium]